MSAFEKLLAATRRPTGGVDGSASGTKKKARRQRLGIVSAHLDFVTAAKPLELAGLRDILAPLSSFRVFEMRIDSVALERARARGQTGSWTLQPLAS